MVAGRNGEQMGLEMGGVRCGLLGPVGRTAGSVSFPGTLFRAAVIFFFGGGG